MIAARRHRRGFSVLELVVAGAVSVAFGMVVSSALVSTSATARDTLGKAAIAEDTRLIADTAGRFLRGAAPAGTCVSPPGVARTDLCERVGAAGPAFEVATADRAVFYSYGTEGTPTDGRLRVPDKIDISVTGTVLTISRYPIAAAAEYVAPAWQGTAETLRTVQVEGASGAFEYFDSTGAALDAATLATTSGREQISLVRFAPVVTLTSGTDTYTSGLDVFAKVDTEAGS